VATDQGPRQTSSFYVNGAEPVVTVETSRGYRLQGTPSHRVRVVDTSGGWQWRRLADLRPGDQVPLMLGGMVGEPRTVPLPPIEIKAGAPAGPRSLTVGLAEFLGHFMGAGSLHPGGLCLMVLGARPDRIAYLQQLSRSLFGLEPRLIQAEDRIEVCLDSAQLARWWAACGFAKRDAEAGCGPGPLPHLPDALLQTNDPAVYRAFLRGLFDAAGTVGAGQISLSGPERFSRDVQTLLLALGIVASLDREEPAGDRPEARCTIRLSTDADAWWQPLLGSESSRQSVAGPGNDPPDQRRSTSSPARAGGVAPARATSQVLECDLGSGLTLASGFLYETVTSAALTEERFTFDLSVPDNVTYVANGFVSHNTIGLMMDCDTTGIEPDLALVKYKKLVGGGMFKIVNNTVPQALSKLGYSEAQVKDIVEYIDDNETIEGAPHLRDQHLKVFDCAFKAVHGVRSIAPMGHIRMMAAIQPFVSGSMSKTVNLPNEATVEDIENVYLESWRLGLKCVSIYRDGCKRSQPLSTKKDGDVATAAAPAEPQPVRRKLPDERHSITHKFDIQGHEGYITVGLYEDGTPGEIFLTMNKEGSTLSGLMDSFATQTSLALQYGVPLRIMVNKFSHMRFEPSGFTKNPEIPIAKSIIDYIFRWLASRFLEPEEQEAVGVVRRTTDTTISVAAPPQAPTARGTPLTFVGDADAPPCPECGAITVRNGTCYKCMNCGATTGCS
jgi:ribonucleoside-diphosphate reductase alpha chain